MWCLCVWFLILLVYSKTICFIYCFVWFVLVLLLSSVCVCCCRLYLSVVVVCICVLLSSECVCCCRLYLCVVVVCMCVLLSSVSVCCCRLYVCGVVCVCVSVDNIFIASLNVSIGASSSEMHRKIFLFCNREKTFETKRLKVIWRVLMVF